LRNATIKLISGIAKDRKEACPEYDMLQKEIEYLFEIYRSEFIGCYSTEYEWKKLWQYNWGSVVVARGA